MTVDAIPAAVLAAWDRPDAPVERLAGGLINATFAVGRDDARIVVQRLHPVFGAEVNLDVEAVTAHLAARGLVTPRLLRTRDGQAWTVDDGGGVWRALSWVDGASVAAVPAPRWAELGGQLVGRFHRAVADLRHDYRFTRAGVHDTALHLARLAARVAGGADGTDEEARTLGAAILAAAAALPALPTLPRRHVHGDLKISNLMFRREPALEAVALVDLDTVGLGTMAFELGDALRSWCNPRGEDAGTVGFDLEIFGAAVAGFRDVADGLLSADERRGIVLGLETVCLELAARFAVDVFDDAYFGWDPARFPSRRAHNLVRAEGQLALGLAVRAAREEALALVMG